MALFWLINLKLVTFSSSLGCQGNACPCVTSAEFPRPALPCAGGQSQSGCSTGVSGTPALFLQCCAAEGKHLFPQHQSCWSLASKPGKDFYNLCPTTSASILVLQTHGISQTQFRALFLHSSVSPYETTPQLKAKQRKKKHPGRKKTPSVLEGCVIYSNSLHSFIKPSLTQNMSP